MEARRQPDLAVSGSAVRALHCLSGSTTGSGAGFLGHLQAIRTMASQPAYDSQIVSAVSAAAEVSVYPTYPGVDATSTELEDWWRAVDAYNDKDKIFSYLVRGESPPDWEEYSVRNVAGMSLHAVPAEGTGHYFRVLEHNSKLQGGL